MLRTATLLATAVFVATTGLARADGDAEDGKKVFRKCMACHDIGENAKNKVGPILTGVVGRTAGTLPGYSYSDAMVQAGKDGVVWSNDELNIYLTNPKELVPGTKMTFAGLKKEEDRANVIAYLDTCQ